MRMMRHPFFSGLFLMLFSAFYAFLFLFISEHLEFQSMVHPKHTLQSDFINAFTRFLMAGSMKQIGYAFLLLALVILTLILLKRKRYDEYQQSILSKCALLNGVMTIALVPLLLLSILSDPNYSIEFIFLFIILHWSCMLITALVYTLRFLR